MRERSVYRVGLTGGIASGKSSVTGLFGALGVPVIDTDLLAREVVVPESPGLAAVVRAFGPQVLQSDGTLNRRRLRDLVFATPLHRQQLEAILHPLIFQRMEAACLKEGGPYQLLVIPLLVESGLKHWVDRVLVVECSDRMQRNRLMVRDGESGEAVDRLLAAQVDRRTRLSWADDVLVNEGSLEDLEKGVKALHAAYLEGHLPSPERRGKMDGVQ